MAAPQRMVELAFSDEEAAELARLARSRTEPASRVERARMLLAYRSRSNESRPTARGPQSTSMAADSASAAVISPSFARLITSSRRRDFGPGSVGIFWFFAAGVGLSERWRL